MDEPAHLLVRRQGRIPNDRFQGFADGGHHPLNESDEDGLAVGEALVEVALGEPRALADRFDGGGAWPDLAHHIETGIQKLFAPLPASLVGADAAIRTDNFAHLDILTRSRSCFYGGWDKRNEDVPTWEVAMACCVAIACVVAAVRAAWAWILGRDPVEEVFPPAATWRSGRVAGMPAPNTSFPTSGPIAETPIGRPLAATVVVYALLIHLLVATGAARIDESMPGGWLARDAVLLGLAVVLMGVASRPMSMPSALVCVGAFWFVLGMVDMHVASGVEIPSLIVDAAFHLSGWWLAVAAAGVLIVERRAETTPLGGSL